MELNDVSVPQVVYVIGLYVFILFISGNVWASYIAMNVGVENRRNLMLL